MKNLRTLQKAQNLYEDVRRHIHIKNQEFLNEIRDICYAIVVEDVDKLYEKLYEQYKEDKSRLDFFAMLYSDFIYRINSKYLSHIQSGENLAREIEGYYRSTSILNLDNINIHYKNFLNAGEKQIT